MSMLRIHDGAESNAANLILYVWSTPDGTGNLHGGLYAYRYSQRTLCIKAGGQIAVTLEDCTNLGLEFSGLLTTDPQIVSPAGQPQPGAPMVINVNDTRTQGLLVFISIALNGTIPTNPQQSLQLYCDPQVGNDPKV